MPNKTKIEIEIEILINSIMYGTSYVRFTPDGKTELLPNEKVIIKPDDGVGS